MLFFVSHRGGFDAIIDILITIISNQSFINMVLNMSSLKISLTLVAALLNPIYAHAWGVVYDMGGSSPSINMLHLESPENSQQQIDENCSRYPSLKGKCRMIGVPAQDAMMVVFVGDAGLGFGTDKDAKRAIQKARKDCEEVSRNCIPEYIGYAARTLYAGIAFGETLGYFVYTNEGDFDAAKNSALKLCLKRDASKSCSAINNFGGSKNTYYSSATSESGKFHSIAENINMQESGIAAIRRCEIDSGEKCALKINGAINYGGTHIAEANRRAMAELGQIIYSRKQRARNQSYLENNSGRMPSASGVNNQKDGCGWQANPNDATNPHMIPKPCG